MDCPRCDGPVSVQGTLCEDCQDRPVRRSGSASGFRARRANEMVKVLTPRQQRAADALRAVAAPRKPAPTTVESDDADDSRWG